MATTTPTTLPAVRPPAFRAPGWGLGTGLALGVLTCLAQGWLPGSWNRIANSGAVWSAAAFAVTAVFARRISDMAAAVTGLLTELGLVVGYYGYAELGRDGMGDLYWPLVWVGAAFVAGPLFGVAGRWSRAGSDSARRVNGTAALAAVCGGEAIYSAQALDKWNEAIALFLVLLLVSLLVPRTMKDRALTLAVAGAFSGLSYLAVTTAGKVVDPVRTIGRVEGLGASELQDRLVALVPPGLEVTEQGGQHGESAYVVVTDDGAASRVEINVQTGMSWAEDELFSDSTRLPDGTLLATSKQEESAGGLVTWSADTLRPDGLRVVVSAHDSGQIDQPATRTSPAITIEQLTAIATDKRWNELS
ncbi:DUF6518 family protein [Streptomyces sp. NPDC002309]